ncbi:hypothetical protein [Reyranella sp.]|uniref:hypothetical protein n=1 Tax=Reyranella sp. TaxID=1929291 RepID=UPI003D0EA2D1
MFSRVGKHQILHLLRAAAARPWAPGDEHRLYQNALDQIELADRLGYDHASQVEHHFLEEFPHSLSPESFLAAASKQTKIFAS